MSTGARDGQLADRGGGREHEPATPPGLPSSDEKLDDLQTRGDGNMLGFGKHGNKSWSDAWRNEQGYVGWAIGKMAEGQQGWAKQGWANKLERFATWAKRMGQAEAELPGTPGKPARPICEIHDCAMTGPHTAYKNALEQNKGRGFYTCPTKCAACLQWANGPAAEECAALTGGSCCGKKGWLWADGSEACSEVSHRRKAEYDAARPHGETGPGPSKRARLNEQDNSAKTGSMGVGCVDTNGLPVGPGAGPLFGMVADHLDHEGKAVGPFCPAKRCLEF